MEPLALTSTVDAVITDVTAVVTAGVGYMGNAATAITRPTPIMLTQVKNMRSGELVIAVAAFPI